MRRHRSSRVTRWAMALIAGVVLLRPGPAAAEDWPARSVRLIVPYPPGGNADVVGRIVAHALQEKLGQPFVVENKAGAGGLIGGETVASAAPDGYTYLLSANGPVLYAPELAARKPYEWHKSFVPVGTASLTSLALVVHPSVPAQTLDEFIALARRDGEKLTFASGGIGTSNHLFSELIQSQAHVKWTTVQYKGTAPAMNDLLGGHVQLSIDQVSASLPHIRAGRVRALAVSGAKRVPWLPDVPTFAEKGYPNLVGYTFVALLAPAGTPGDVVRKFAAALKAVVGDPAVKKQIETLGAEPEAMLLDDFRAYLDKESEVWLPVVRSVTPPQ